MASRPIYKTKQREEILAYLETRPGEHITAAAVCGYFQEKGTPIGQSTVYRQLEKMVAEGLLNKYTIDAGTPACFEFVQRHEHTHGGTCFHCKCEKCGRLIHMHCEELEGIGAHLKDEHGFVLDPLRTVFYGVCAECAGGLR